MSERWLSKNKEMPPNFKIKIFLDDGKKGTEKRILAKENASILKALTSANIQINSLCNGDGKCGKCRIVVKKGEVKRGKINSMLLTKKELNKNYSLACQTFPISDLEIFIPQESKLKKHQILEHFWEEGEFWGKKELSERGEIGLAIDVGTTTIVIYLVDLTTRNIVDVVSGYNKQLSLGEDVLTRISHANKEGSGGSSLQRLVVETINELIEKLKLEIPNLERIDKIVATGNTAMTYLLLNKDTNLIQTDILSEEFRKPNIVKDAKELGMKAKGELYTLPGVGGWVGGDIIADILASELYRSNRVSMLIDVGTNGEIAIGNEEFLICCSTSAGPAFEGREVKFGMRAMRGAIEEVKIPDNYEVEYATIDNEKPQGICGSGLIDLLAELFLKGVIDYKGKINSALEKKTKRVRKNSIEKEFVVVWKNETAMGRDIVITERDIQNILRSKAAIYAGASSLTKAGITFGELDKIFICGGFGHFLDVEKAIILGLLPDIEREKFKFIGNGSVRGAYLVLTEREKKKEAEEIAKRATYLDLIKDRNFAEEYMNALYLPHLNLERFPTVEKKIEKVM